MPHMDLPPCLSTDETREGRERGDRATESPARARTALCPRRHRRDLSPPFRPPEAETHPPNASMNVFLVDSPTRESWRFYSSLPRKPQRPTWLAGRLPQMNLFPALPPHPLRNDPFTVTAAGPKRNSEVLQELQAYQARQGEHGDHDGLVDQVDEQRVPAQRQERPGGDRCFRGEARWPAAVGVYHVPEE